MNCESFSLFFLVTSVNHENTDADTEPKMSSFGCIVRCIVSILLIFDLRIHYGNPLPSRAQYDQSIEHVKDIVVLWVCELPHQQTLILGVMFQRYGNISRFVYLENDAIFAIRGNRYFRSAIEGS